MNIRFLLPILCFLFVACKPETPLPPSPNPAPNSLLLSWQTGRNDFQMEVDSSLRSFIIHVPTSYDSSQAVPMVFMLHGSSGTGGKFYNISKWVEKSEAENFIAIFPTAEEYPLTNGRTSTKWTSDGLAKDVVPGTEIGDDVIFLEAIIAHCKATFHVDSQRLYISGFSNGGGFIKSQVIPRMGQTFAAAGTSGGAGIPVAFPIEGGRTMPLFNITGSKDEGIMEGIGVRAELPLQGDSLMAHDFLWNGLTTLCEMLAVDTTFTEVNEAPTSNRLVFDQSLGGAPEYVFVMVKDMEHVYPNGTNNPRGYVAVDPLWEWFRGYTL